MNPAPIDYSARLKPSPFRTDQHDVAHSITPIRTATRRAWSAIPSS